MRVLFIYTNINGHHEDNYGFGLASIISVTREAGHEVKAMLVWNEEQYGDVVDTIRGYEPEVVGFTAVSSQFQFVRELAKIIKNIPSQAIIVCGGVHTTLYPECVLEADALDAVFVGESEEAFKEFLDKVPRNEYLSCSNIAYASNGCSAASDSTPASVNRGSLIGKDIHFLGSREGMLVRNPIKPLISDLDALPHPDRHVYPYVETLNRVGYAPFHFARGCPFLCTYCSNHALAKIYGQSRYKVRLPSPEYCICELEDTIKEFPSIGQTHNIGIDDDIFGLNKRWRHEFLKLYAERVKVPFWILLRADVVNEKFIKDLKEAGCYRIQFGVESGNEYIRNEVMKRSMSQDTIVQAFDLCHRYGLETNAINIIGVPGETEEMLWDTIKLNRKLRPTDSGVNIFYPYRGTVLGDHCFENALVDEKKFEEFSNERRETVLNYPEEWRNKLAYYHRNWEHLVFLHDYSYGRLRKRMARIPGRLKSRIVTLPLVGGMIHSSYRSVRKVYRERLSGQMSRQAIQRPSSKP